MFDSLPAMALLLLAFGLGAGGVALIARRRLQAQRRRFKLLIADRQHFAAFADLTSDYLGIDTVDTEGRCTFSWGNQAMRSLLDSTRINLQQGGALESVSHPDDRETVRGHLKEMLQNRPQRFRARIITATEDVRWIEAHALPFRMDSQSPVSSILYTASDITDQVDREHSHKEDKARFKNLIEQVPAIIYVANDDESHQTVYISPQIEQMMGYTPEEWLEDPDLWSRCIHPDDRDDVLNAYKKTLDQGQPFAREYRVRTRDGELRWVRDEATPVMCEGECADCVVCIQGVVLDITARRLAELATQERERQLRAFFNADAMMMGVTEVKNESQRFIIVNDRLATFFKHPRKAIEGKTSVELGIAQAMRTLWLQNYNACAHTGKPVRFEYQSEATKHWLAATICEIEQRECGAIRFAIIVEDVTQQKIDEEQLQLLNRELNHRVKNNLAKIHALATRIAGNSDTLLDFNNNFLSLVKAMCRTTGIVAPRSRRSAYAARVLHLALEDLVISRGLTINADDTQLDEKQVFTLTLFAHELGVNAVKHGALTTPNGRVVVRAQRIESAEGQRFELYWREENGPPVTTPTKLGFGAELIQQLARTDLHGKLDTQYNSSGFSCTLTFPLTLPQEPTDDAPPKVVVTLPIVNTSLDA